MGHDTRCRFKFASFELDGVGLNRTKQAGRSLQHEAYAFELWRLGGLSRSIDFGDGSSGHPEPLEEWGAWLLGEMGFAACSVYQSAVGFVSNLAATIANALVAAMAEAAPLASGFFGAVDGFLDAVNPFDAWASVPDIGAYPGPEATCTAGTYVGLAGGVIGSMAVGNLASGASGRGSAS